MLKRIWHFLFGHKWSNWKSFIYSPGYYDEERWKERTCKCGAKETDED